MTRANAFATAIVATVSSLAVAATAQPTAIDAPSAQIARSPQTPAAFRRARLQSVRSWAIQLRNVDPKEVAASPYDLVVVDPATQSAGTSDDTTQPVATVSAMKAAPDGGTRIVLAYLSIGEAEHYRDYWRKEWESAAGRPAWLGKESTEWPGNYKIDYASPDWQSIIFGSPESFLDRIIDAGFDGAFLDRADAFQDADKPGNADGEAMVRFVSRLADYAHRRNPDFLIVMQNAEELLQTRGLHTRLDGFAKEDLIFGHDNTSAANPSEMVVDSLSMLRLARQSGLPVMLLEYAAEPDKIAAAEALGRREGLLVHIGERTLSTLTRGAPPLPQPARQARNKPAIGDPRAAP